MSFADKDTQSICDSICELGSVPRTLNADDLRSEIDQLRQEIDRINRLARNGAAPEQTLYHARNAAADPSHGRLPQMTVRTP